MCRPDSDHSYSRYRCQFSTSFDKPGKLKNTSVAGRNMEFQMISRHFNMHSIYQTEMGPATAKKICIDCINEAFTRCYSRTYFRFEV